jgi:hypothetical protein
MGLSAVCGNAPAELRASPHCRVGFICRFRSLQSLFPTVKQTKGQLLIIC